MPGNQDKLWKGLVCASLPVGFEETKNNKDIFTRTVSPANTESSLRKLSSMFSPTAVQEALLIDVSI